MLTDTLNGHRLVEAEAVTKSVRFPSPPALLNGIQQELEQPEPEFKKIADLLNQDLALTSKILKLVNSPFYTTSQEIYSSPQALAMLGLENFRDIVLASTMQEATYNPNMPRAQFDLFFKHSLKTAKIAEMIAKVTFPGDSKKMSLAFMAGLFHDCGIPILAKRFPDYFDKILPVFAESKTLEAAEESVYKTNHGVAGSLIANTWKLPPLVRQVIFFHHHEDFSFHADEDLLELLSIVMLAEKIIVETDENAKMHQINIYQSVVSEACFIQLMNKLNLTVEQLSILGKKCSKT